MKLEDLIYVENQAGKPEEGAFLAMVESFAVSGKSPRNRINITQRVERMRQRLWDVAFKDGVRDPRRRVAGNERERQPACFRRTIAAPSTARLASVPDAWIARVRESRESPCAARYSG